jgi:tRNA nucleotidyltransferase (CCA-adding enzyme)
LSHIRTDDPPLPHLTTPGIGAPRDFLAHHARWLFEPDLCTCIVGSTALREAIRRSGGGPEPTAMDLDLSWALGVKDAEELLKQRGVFLQTTGNSRGRGTVAMRIGGRRIEVTTFRAGADEDPLPVRIAADTAARDMTVGAVAWSLHDDQIHDPQGGLLDYRSRRIRVVGEVRTRLEEHPVRWLRYFRRAHEWGFELDPRLRREPADPALLARIPAEALAAEVRALLQRCRSPGRCLLELHEARLLEILAPELDHQFDGRPAGPQRHHPEVSQALHLILALEWTVTHVADFNEEDRLAALIAVLTHDLGKGWTVAERLPAHHGHEQAGAEPIATLLGRMPGLADAKTARLAEAVAVLHTEMRRFDTLRPGTLVDLYERWIRPKDFRIDLFAIALAADEAGRLGMADTGLAARALVERRLHWLRTVCESVDAKQLRMRHPDVEGFRAALHEARARAIRQRRFTGT